MRFQSARQWVAAAMLTGLFFQNQASAEDSGVRDAIVAYVAAFNAKDTQSLVKMWTEDASHVDHGLAETTAGRDQIMADIEAVFEQPEEIKLSGTIDSVHMITENVAKVAGEVSVTVSEQEPSLNRYSAILVKHDAAWQIDSMEEMPVPQPASSEVALTPLDWLIGDWQDETDEDPVHTHVHRSIGGAFLIRSCESESARSTQIIGWDAGTREIQSWTFNSDGSHGTEVWTQNGDDWLVRTKQTLADGRAASGTYVIHPENGDELTIKLMGREIDGEPQLPSDPVTLRRLAAAPE